MNLFFITSSIHLHRFMRLDRLDPGSRDVLPFPDGPKFSLVSVRPAAKVLEGSVVTLSCSSNANPAADHIWYIGNQVIFSRGPILDFVDIRPEDSGNYSCRSKNLYGEEDSAPVFVDVQCECVT